MGCDVAVSKIYVLQKLLFNLGFRSIEGPEFLFALDIEWALVKGLWMDGG